ncbi:MAG: tryptophan--tRNA ligase, partial [Clostridia bacterium]|nr:tryptophan--tRNA ligase [Clostridia bacterium]
ADILLYQADLVPVGEDQKQHLELCRDIAGRFNGIYGDVLKVPEPYIPKVGARIMSLQNPTSKMSKSDANVNGFILLTDDKDTIIRKFKRAVTDSDAKVEFKEGKDGINNLISIYVAATGKSIEETVAEFDGKGYGDFKLAVGEAVAEMLGPVTKKYNDLLANKDYLMQVYKSSAEIAEKIAMRTMRKVYKKIGFTEK